MATVDGPKYMGALTFDISDVASELVDLAPGALKGVRAEQEGFDKMAAELAQAMPGHGDAAEIPPQVYQRFLARTALLGKLRVHEVALEKALEVCRETRAKTENDREDDISVLARAPQEAARRAKNPGLAAPFQETIKYNTQAAERAVLTRKKNAEAKAEAEKSGQGGGAPPVGG